MFGVDFSTRMLERARAKRDAGFPRAQLMEGDALELPLPDDRVAAATVAFGVRNLADLDRGFRELARVVRPGGTVVCLEITQPQRGPLARSTACGSTAGAGRGPRRRPPRRLRLLVPAGVREALPVRRRARPGDVRAGLRDVRYTTVAGGIVALHTGRVPA